jgi:hypothetical protein
MAVKVLGTSPCHHKGRQWRHINSIPKAMNLLLESSKTMIFLGTTIAPLAGVGGAGGANPFRSPATAAPEVRVKTVSRLFLHSILYLLRMFDSRNENGVKSRVRDDHPRHY